MPKQTGSVTVLQQHNVSVEDKKLQEEGQQDNLSASHELTDSTTQMDDSAAFYTFYEHTQAQRQETLLLEEQLDRTLHQFNRSLSDIIEHQDGNFQFLTHQLCCEFNAYMQFALSNAVNHVIPIPPPLCFNHPGSSNFPPVPDFHTAYNSHFVDEFEKIEIEIQTNITDQESRGVRPPEKQRPWSHHPFGRRTRSQEQFAKRHAQREEHLERRRQNQSHELLVSAAVQAALSLIPLHRPTREDIDEVPIRKRRVENVPSQVATITEIEETEDNENNGRQPLSTIAEIPKETSVKHPPYYQKPYYFPDIPPLPSFGRGTNRIPLYVQQWLEDNPGFTEKNFWERQVVQHKYAHIPAYVTGDDRPYLDNDSDRYQDAPE